MKWRTGMPPTLPQLLRCRQWGPAVLGLFLLNTSTAYGLPDDQDQPIHISADKAVRDEKRGLTIYHGNVQMRQGSMELDANKLTIFHNSEDADKIVAQGAPARMRQQPKVNEGLVHAHAQVITYFRIEDRVNLQSEASLEQDGALVTGNSIDYFIAQQLVKAESDTNDAQNKVFVVIPPTSRRVSDTESTPSP